MFNGGIYGIPIPRGAIGSYNFIRQDLFEAAGLSPEPKGYDELLETSKALTDLEEAPLGLRPVQPTAPGLLGRMNGEPNPRGGRRAASTPHTYETEEYKQTITDLIAFWKAGVMHPDSFNTAQPFKALFNAGTVAINAADGYPGWNQYILDNAGNPDFKLGSDARLHPGQAASSPSGRTAAGSTPAPRITKQEDPERLKMLLRVLNYLAAPFGTEEYLYRLLRWRTAWTTPRPSPATRC